jgi:hypothetical protein
MRTKRIVISIYNDVDELEALQIVTGWVSKHKSKEDHPLQGVVKNGDVVAIRTDGRKSLCFAVDRWMPTV